MNGAYRAYYIHSSYIILHSSTSNNEHTLQPFSPLTLKFSIIPHRHKKKKKNQLWVVVVLSWYNHYSLSKAKKISICP